MGIIKRVIQGLVVLVLIFVALVMGMYGNYRSKGYVDLEKNEPEIVVFYRSDCSTCKKVYPKITVKAAQDFKNPRFVNLAGKQNRKYIKQYKIKSVPTTINLKTNKRYSGSNLEKIDHVMNPEQIGFFERIKSFWNSVKD